ncbi:beta-ketoacyl synthase N-terminal-like domain-containing protein [Nocardia sp. NPDC052112]|uniref:beta-ketoacyl synthase N-terminal-like domain-containing protein n=1 Tax=Nocardia sp. NPDC052112 TaxID=3155646 RepID=UPI003448CD19
MSATAEVPIAVVGVGCRFPGGVSTPPELRTLMVRSRSTAAAVPADRWDAAGLAAVHDSEEAVRTGRGCFLDGDVWAWDPQCNPLNQSSFRLRGAVMAASRHIESAEFGRGSLPSPCQSSSWLSSFPWSVLTCVSGSPLFPDPGGSRR